MQSAAIKAGYLSYLDNAPFVLRMDIQGFNELGQNLSTIKPKFFVCSLTSTKFTVSETGSPRHSEWSKIACVTVAAVTPPNGPTILAQAGCVLPR